MRRLTFAGLAVICALAFSALVASGPALAATQIRTASRAILFVTARGPVTMTFAGTNIICTFDILIGFGASISKTPLAWTFRVYGPGSTISNCNGGYSGTIDSSADVQYAFFTGTLPAITLVSGISPWDITLTGGTVFGTNRCSYRGGHNFTMGGGSNNFTQASVSSPSVITSNAACPGSGAVGRGTLTLYANASLGSTLTAIAVALA